MGARHGNYLGIDDGPDYPYIQTTKSTPRPYLATGHSTRARFLLPLDYAIKEDGKVDAGDMIWSAYNKIWLPVTADDTRIGTPVPEYPAVISKTS